MKIKIKMKKKSYRYDITRPRPRDGHKNSKYKRCLSMMMFICIKQQQSNIWSSIYEKVKQHWTMMLHWKKALLIKRVDLQRNLFGYFFVCVFLLRSEISQHTAFFFSTTKTMQRSFFLFAILIKEFF